MTKRLCINTCKRHPSLALRLAEGAGAASMPSYFDGAIGTFVDSQPDVSSCIASAEEIIAEAAAARMAILVDDEDRESEGDLIILAQFATTGIDEFMALHACGPMCPALTDQRAANCSCR